MQVRKLADSMDGRHERIQTLSKLLTELKQDMMNRTLYALTLVTFLATPVMLLTGTFGMNFDDMHELVQPLPPPDLFGHRPRTPGSSLHFGGQLHG